jgi:hypothetical protein
MAAFPFLEVAMNTDSMDPIISQLLFVLEGSGLSVEKREEALQCVLHLYRSDQDIVAKLNVDGTAAVTPYGVFRVSESKRS